MWDGSGAYSWRYTGALQVLDKGINKPFKNHYQSQQRCWEVGKKIS